MQIVNLTKLKARRKHLHMTRKDIIREFYELDIIQFGEFQLKSGMISPFYIDMRKIVSHTPVFKAICIKIWDQIKEDPFDFVCGVPYAGLVFASAAGAMFNLPLVMARKEPKKHGKGRMIEGDYHLGEKVILIEDTVTSGASLLSTIEHLTEAGLDVHKVVCIVDRMQGGSELLRKAGMQVNCLFTMQEMVSTMQELGKLTEEQADYIMHFIYENPAPLQLTEDKTPAEISDMQNPIEKEHVLTAVSDQPKIESASEISNVKETKDKPPIIPITKAKQVPLHLPSYKERITDSLHPVTKRLLGIMVEKETNLVASADLSTVKQLIEFAEQIGPQICALKTHTDIYPSLGLMQIKALKRVAAKHNFLLMEDRKFCDIGYTVQKQFRSAMCSISDWADMITAHVIAGGSTIAALEQVIDEARTGIVVVAEMSTSDTLTSQSYVENAADIVKHYNNSVIGAVAQSRILENASLLQFMPGIKLFSGTDGLGQQYNTPEVAIQQRGADLLIVGRGIYQARNPSAAARQFRNNGWKAYLSRKGAE